MDNAFREPPASVEWSGLPWFLHLWVCVGVNIPVIDVKASFTFDQLTESEFPPKKTNPQKDSGPFDSQYSAVGDLSRYVRPGKRNMYFRVRAPS